MEAQPPTTRPNNGRSPVTRFRRWCRRLCFLVLFAGLAFFAGRFFLLDRLDLEIRARTLATLREHHPQLRIYLKSARRVEGRGVELRGLSAYSKEHGGKPLLKISEVFVECSTDLRDFVLADLRIKRVTVKRLHGRLIRRQNGGWSLLELLPQQTGPQKALPPIDIVDSRIEIRDELNRSRPIRLDNLRMAIDSRSLTKGAYALQAGGAIDAGREATPIREPWQRIRCRLQSNLCESAEIAGLYQQASGDWRVEATLKRLALSPDVWSLLPKAFQPARFGCRKLTGVADLNVKLRRPEQPGKPERRSGSRLPIDVEISGELKGGHLVHQRLPFALTALRTGFHFSDEGLRLNDLRCWHGSTAVFADFERWGHAPKSPAKLHFKARGLRLIPSLVSIWPEKFAPVWRAYQPQGIVDVDFNLDTRRPVRPASAQEGPYQSEVVFRCHDTSFAYRSFPYRMEHTQGVITFRDGRLQTKDLRTKAGQQTVHILADLQNPQSNSLGFLEVTTAGPIPIDRKFIQALPPEMRKGLTSLAPGGWFTVDKYRIESFEPGVARHYADIHLNNCNLRFVRFPYPISRINGRLTYRDGTLSTEDITGYHGSTYLKCQGKWNHTNKELPALEITASDVVLEEDLRTAIETVSPSAAKLWQSLRLEGAFDHVRLNLTARDGRPNVEFVLQKWRANHPANRRKLSISPRWFAYRLENMTGVFHYRDGLLSMRKVRAEHGKSTIHAMGQCRFDGQGWRIDLEKLGIDDLKFDHDLLRALAGNVRAACDRLRPTGSIVLQGKVGVWNNGTSPKGLRANWDVAIALANAELTCGPRLKHINGSVHLTGGLLPHGFECRGDVDLDSAFLYGEQLTRIRGPLWMDSEKVLLGAWAERNKGEAARGLTAKVYGGHVTLHAQVVKSPQPHFVMVCELDGADVGEVAREYARQGRGVTGKANGTLQISGRVGEIHSWRGNGDLHLYEADIYQLPQMVALLKLLSIRRPDATAFTTSDATFKVEGDRILFDRIDFNGDAISLRGTGWMSFDKQLDLNFYTLVGRNKVWVPIVSRLVAEASRNLFQIKVQGTLAAPDIDRLPLPELDGTIQRLFPELARRDQKSEGPFPRTREFFRNSVLRR